MYRNVIQGQERPIRGEYCATILKMPHKLVVTRQNGSSLSSLFRRASKNLYSRM